MTKPTTIILNFLNFLPVRRFFFVWFIVLLAVHMFLSLFRCHLFIFVFGDCLNIDTIYSREYFAYALF